MLEQKLTEAKSKKNTLKARAKSAQTTRQINDMIQGLNLNNSMAAFERMEEKVMALESESEATLQVRSTCKIFRAIFLSQAKFSQIWFFLQNSFQDRSSCSKICA